ncbi:RhoGAP-domain-containing protein [Tuber magnatum]|uniref:RhoGAP-domain-containing protein n=1 Tax=Tuber magnatum TaxID=42249 RepID=A0A317SY68_9PEZI|nr:RhoGAP-domain-containing protein [Tuber magnatum]
MIAAGGPSPGAHPGSPPAKASLASWWEKFKKRPAPKEEGKGENRANYLRVLELALILLVNHPATIFSVPLHRSIKYANVAISLTDVNGEQFIYGYVPIVVAKCGVFLKERATDVEGIFRLSGSAKRIKDLQAIFDSPDTYGKGLDWTGYTVHDAANVLRRYLNQLPEPIIPLDFYYRFREPLAIQPEGQEVLVAIKSYQRLISELPPLNQQLLLYILDLLAVFASKAELNLMNASNLAAIFQPGLISHPSHDMAPGEYKLSQEVLVFLITHQDHFLLGMRGNEDQNQISLGALNTPSSPRLPKAMVSRSSSSASATADEVRKFGGVRRNVSATSRRSSGSPVVGSAGAAVGGVSGSSLNRRNTLPPKRSPAVRPAAFAPGDVSPSPNSPHTYAPASNVKRSPSVGGQICENVSPASPDATSAEPRHEASNTSPPRTEVSGQVPREPPRELPRDHLESLQVEPQSVITPTKERTLQNFFSLSPEGDRPSRPANKLRKKRIPGSGGNSAESSTASLPGVSGGQNPNGPAPSSHATLEPSKLLFPRPQSPPPHLPNINIASPSSSQTDQASAGNPSSVLMPAMSPTPSATSSMTSHSSAHSRSDTAANPTSSPGKTVRLWRLSNPQLENLPGSSTSSNGGESSGSLVERIRRASRSPPARQRSISGEVSRPVEEGNHAKAPRNIFGQLQKAIDERGQHSELEKEKEREDEREDRQKAERHVAIQMEQFIYPKSPPVQPCGPSPSSVQPPSPLSQHQVDMPSPMSSIQEKRASPLAVDGPTEQLRKPTLSAESKQDSEETIRDVEPKESLERVSVPGESIEPEGRAPHQPTEAQVPEQSESRV